MSRKRLNSEQQRQAKEMRAHGRSYREIGRALGACASTIYLLLNPEARERKRAYDAKYCETNRERRRLYSAKYREEHSEAVRTYARKHQKENLAYYEALNSARRALVAGAFIGATIAQKAEIVEIYRRAREDKNVRCYICGKKIPLGHRHVDHIVPLSKGGKHVPSNLAIACDECNLSKHDKLPEEMGFLL